MYKIEKRHIILEGLVLVAFSFLLIFYQYLPIKLASVIFVVFIVRDIYRMMGTTYELSEEGIQLKVRDKVREDRKWKDMDYITRSRKNTRIVALVFDKDVVAIPPYVENFEGMIKEIFELNAKNKHVSIHESIPSAFNLNIQLKDNGKMKIK